jgi:hypothetical protein
MPDLNKSAIKTYLINTPCVEAGSNTSTVTLRVVGGDEKESLKSETVKYGREFQGTRDPRKTAMARASSIYKRQTRPLVREGAPRKQDRNCQRVTNIWPWAPDGARHQDLLTDWLTDRQSQCDFDFDLKIMAELRYFATTLFNRN